MAHHRWFGKPPRSLTIPERGDTDLEHFAFMINRTPEIARLPMSLHEDLVQVPAPLRQVADHRRKASYLG